MSTLIEPTLFEREQALLEENSRLLQENKKPYSDPRVSLWGRRFYRVPRAGNGHSCP